MRPDHGFEPTSDIFTALSRSQMKADQPSQHGFNDGLRLPTDLRGTHCLTCQSCLYQEAIIEAILVGDDSRYGRKPIKTSGLDSSKVIGLTVQSSVIARQAWHLHNQYRISLSVCQNEEDDVG